MVLQEDLERVEFQLGTTILENNTAYVDALSRLTGLAEQTSALIGSVLALEAEHRALIKELQARVALLEGR